jgi:hypothetical protein
MNCEEYRILVVVFCVTKGNQASYDISDIAYAFIKQ